MFLHGLLAGIQVVISAIECGTRAGKGSSSPEHGVKSKAVINATPPKKQTPSKIEEKNLSVKNALKEEQSKKEDNRTNTRREPEDPAEYYQKSDIEERIAKGAEDDARSRKDSGGAVDRGEIDPL